MRGKHTKRRPNVTAGIQTLHFTLAIDTISTISFILVEGTFSFLVVVKHSNVFALHLVECHQLLVKFLMLPSILIGWSL